MLVKVPEQGTLPDVAAHRLAHSIVTGELAQGQKLNEAELAERFGMGRGPLREALRHLEVMRLVKRIPNAGARVVGLPTPYPRTIVIDFSSPNVAKPMHVGHIRSTVLGDCLARVLRLLGHHVVTDNHIGDWGTQFGKLIVGWKRHLDPAALQADPIGEMERLYRLVNAAGETDPAILDAARQRTRRPPDR